MMFQYARLAGAVFLSRATLLGSEAARAMDGSRNRSDAHFKSVDTNARSRARLVELVRDRPTIERRRAKLACINAIRCEPDPDYLSFLTDNREKGFVPAIGYPNLSGLGKEADVGRRRKRKP